MTIILDHERGERVGVTDQAPPAAHSFIVARGKHWYVEGNAGSVDDPGTEVCLVREWRPSVYSA